MPSLQAPLAVAALAGVLALASASSGALLACGMALIVLIFTLGATSTSRAHVPQWAGVLAAVAGIGALTWTYLEETAELTPMVALLGPALLISIVVQLWRRDEHAKPTSTLMLAVTTCVLALLPVSWLALRGSADGIYSVGLALLGVGSVALAEMVPVSRAVRRVCGVLVAAVAAAVLVMAVDEVGEPVPAVSAVVVAAFAGLMAAIAFAAVDRLADEWAVAPAPVPARVGGAPSAGTAESPANPPAAVAGRFSALIPLRVSMPFIAAAPAAYVLGRLFVG